LEDLPMPDRLEGCSPADRIATECIAVRVRALNRAITALYDEALRPHGLRVGQLNLLVAIARMGSTRAGDLCRLLHMDKSTLSRDVEVLRRNGWLEASEPGGRARPLTISRDGQALLEQIVPAWREAQEKARHLLGENGADAILQMAHNLRSDGAAGL
jgi:DNA-binding MarR family transcriptional regulator